MNVPSYSSEEALKTERLKSINADLLAALKFLVNAAETGPGMSIYKAHIDAARAAIAKATQTRGPTDRVDEHGVAIDFAEGCDGWKPDGR